MNLFQAGDFTLRGGRKSIFKLECDALTPEDWDGLAAMAVEFLPPFGSVVGVPRGGLRFADALRKYATSDSDLLLIAEDVCTTGGSMERFLEDVGSPSEVWGVCVFARGPVPDWAESVFPINPKLYGK